MTGDLCVGYSADSRWHLRRLPRELRCRACSGHLGVQSELCEQTIEFASGASEDFAAGCNTPPAELLTIAEIASGDERFSTLVELVTAAGLVRPAEAEGGPYTVFAPTNEALQLLLQRSSRTRADGCLSAVLLGHIVPGANNAEAVLGAAEHTTLAMTTLAVDAEATPPTIGGAGIILTDIEASNGYIHAIDTVILPAE